MKVTIIHPRWYEIHNLITQIINDVCGEGGDGWGWVQVSDPNKWSTALYNQLLTLGWGKDYLKVYFKDGEYYVNIDQEGWTFSTKECDQIDCYDMIYKIEE